MTQVPYNRVVNVSVEISDRFPTAQNFGTPILLTTDDASDIDTDTVRTFSNLAGVKAYGFDTDSAVYKSVQAMLAVRRAPRTFKVGYLDTADTSGSLAALLAKDADFYTMVLCEAQSAADSTALLEMNTFALTHKKLVFFHTEETGTRDDPTAGDTLAALIRGTSPSRLAGFYRDAAAVDSAGDAAAGGARKEGDDSTAAGGEIFGAEFGAYSDQTDDVIAIRYSADAEDGIGDATSLLAENLNASAGTSEFEFVAPPLPAVRPYAWRIGEDFFRGTFSGSTISLPITHNDRPLAVGHTVFKAGDIVRVRYVDSEGAGSFAVISVDAQAGGGTTTSTPSGPVQHYAEKAAAYVSSVDYNQRDAHYTLKFKRLDGAAAAKLNGAQAQAITGFIPAVGNSSTAGGFLNTYVRTGDLNYLVEGVFADGKFIDVTTFADWLHSAMQRNVMAVFLNNPVITYDAAGITALVSAVTQTLEIGLISGALTETRTDADGNLLDAFEVEVSEIGEVAANLQAQRIAPKITFCARYAGAVHYVDIIGELKIAN